MDQSKSCTKEDKWRADMIIRINETNTNVDTHVYTEISKPPKALVDVKPESYCPQILTIGPLYEMLSGSSSLYDCKALCVKRFMRRNGISDVEQLIQCLFEDSSDLRLDYSDLPNYSDEALKLMVTVDTIFLNEFLMFLKTDWDSEEHDFFFNTICDNGITIKQVWKDLFLMGNQIPLSFLRKLMFPKKLNLENDELLEALADIFTFVDPFIIKHAHARDNSFKTPDFLHCNHLLDCLYVWVISE